MNKKEVRYYSINAVVIMTAAILFIQEYQSGMDIFKGESFLSFFVLAIMVVLVHMVKAGRLYLALYGSEMSRSTYLKTYCKVTPVSVVMPFKLGEFFRMYCYGKELNHTLKGIVIILLDRFMDTAALVTTMLFMWIVKGGAMISLTYLLVMFLVFVWSIYMVFPGLYQFWNRYLIKAKASGNRLAVLKMMETMNRIYGEIEGVTKGRGILLYFMSLTAWLIEIGSVAVIYGKTDDSGMIQAMTDYLMSAMYGGQSIRLKQFVGVSVVLLTVLYFFIKIKEEVSRKRNHK